MEGLTTKQGTLPGKTIAIFAGVHGNERVGLEAFAKLLPSLELARGTAHFVEANPPAIAQNVRMIDKNLNRCFLENNAGTTYEDERARELMALLDDCDALLDIHSSNSRETTPFVICEREALPLAATLPFDIVSTGWDALEPGGTDGYMHRTGKLGAGVECGSVFDLEANLERAIASIEQFLRYFGLLDGTAEPSIEQQHIEVYKVAHKQSDTLAFAKEYRDFEPLPAGTTFATDGDTQHIAEEGDRILFARPNTRIGAEAFLLGRIVE